MSGCRARGGALTVGAGGELALLPHRHPPAHARGPAVHIAKDEPEEVRRGHVQPRHDSGLGGTGKRGHPSPAGPGPVLPPPRPAGPGEGLSRAHLDGRHLRVAPPAEVLELEGVEAEAHGAAVGGGRLLQLQAHVVQVWQEVVGRRPATARRSGAARQGPRGAPPRRPVPRPGWGTHSLQVGPWVLGRQRQAPVRGSQPWPSAPPTSHRQPRARGAGHAHRRPPPCSLHSPPPRSGPSSFHTGPWGSADRVQSNGQRRQLSSYGQPPGALDNAAESRLRGEGTRAVGDVCGARDGGEGGLRSPCFLPSWPGTHPASGLATLGPARGPGHPAPSGPWPPQMGPRDPAGRNALRQPK